MTELKEVLEKEVVAEFLQLFKESPCLWDPNNAMYHNKEARASAHELLMEKYKIVHPNANIPMMKKKLENMRTSFRREHRKIVKELLKNGTDRKPSLWYYENLKFLAEVMEGHGSIGSLEMEEEEDDDTKLKIETSMSSIYQDPEEDIDMLTRDSYVIAENPTTKVDNLTEGEAFGRALGLQLSELQPIQRYIAEKLISEVIYHGRFQKLCINTRLHNV